MKIATFNVQNFYMKKDKDFPKYYNKLKNLINFYDLDIIGMQEVVDILYNKLKEDFNISGNSRMFINSKYNEYNPIVSKYKLLYTKTYHLKSLYSFIPRIATVSIYDVNGEKLRIINTHLALYKYHNIKKIEFKKLIKIIKEENMKTILMGDLNLRKESDDLKILINMLKECNMSMIKSDNTFKDNILDYIFITNNIKCKNVKVIDKKLSDHRFLLCEIDVN